MTITKHPGAQALGKLGGHARAKSHTKAQLSAFARLGSQARWHQDVEISPSREGARLLAAQLSGWANVQVIPWPNGYAVTTTLGRRTYYLRTDGMVR